MQEYGKQIFGAGADGSILVHLMWLAVGTFLLDAIAHAVGKAQVAQYINLVAGLVAFGRVTVFVIGVATTIGKFLGVF